MTHPNGIEERAIDLIASPVVRAVKDELADIAAGLGARSVALPVYDVAEGLDVSRSTVNAHWREWGGYELGSGAKAAIRFSASAPEPTMTPCFSIPETGVNQRPRGAGHVPAVRPPSCLRPSTWVAAQVDGLVAESDELRDLQELAAELPRPIEYESVRSPRKGNGRAELTNRLTLSTPGEARSRAGASKAEGRQGGARAQGRCRMLAQPSWMSPAGKVGPGDPGRQPGETHLSRCWICRPASCDGLDGAGRVTGA